jgi:sugar lactone lactonase YvrE
MRPAASGGLAPAGFLGSGLRRPESVLVGPDGTITVSELGGVARLLAPDGTTAPFGRPPEGVDFLPNGLAHGRPGELLVANAGPAGGVWSVRGPDEEARPWLMEADGLPLPHANFVLPHGPDRFWVTVSTRMEPASSAYDEGVADGLVVLVEPGGARVAAEGLRFANECRLGPDGRLYVAETAGARISRMEPTPGGGLGPRQTFCELDPDIFPEGLAFDPEGDLWATGVVSNVILRIRPDGSWERVVSDPDPAHVRSALKARTEGRLAREHFYRGGGRILEAPTSLAFLDPRGRSLVVGSLTASRLAVFLRRD